MIAILSPWEQWGIEVQKEEAIVRNSELQRSKDILLGLLREVEMPLRGRDEIAIENAPDIIDQVQFATEREMAVRQIDSDFNRLQKIRLALRRIDDGSYGTCVHCDGEIGKKRLKALPWVALCVSCQEVADGERASVSEETLRAF
jgi:RNA polymerase-binding transcription factor